MTILDASAILSPYVERILGDIDPSTFMFPARLSRALQEARKGIQDIAVSFQIPPIGLVSVYQAFEEHKDWYERGIAPAKQGNEAHFQTSFFARAKRHTDEYAASIMAEAVTLSLIYSSMILALDAVSLLTWATLTEVFGSQAVSLISLDFGDPGPFEIIPMSLETIAPFRPRLIQIAGPPLKALDQMTIEDYLTLCRTNAFTISYDGVNNAP